MNPDTIFPALTNGEQIIRRFANSVGKSMQFVAIITSHRLLTRTKQTICCCYHHSSYSATSLESIHCIDEYRPRPNTPLYSILWIFWLLAAAAGIVVSVLYVNDQTIRIVGIVVSAVVPFIIMGLITFIRLCCGFKTKFIELKGTFGSRTLLLEKSQARLFEANLSEQISQSKLRLQQTSIPPTYPSVYYPRNETSTIDQKMVISSQF